MKRYRVGVPTATGKSMSRSYYFGCVVRAKRFALISWINRDEDLTHLITVRDRKEEYDNNMLMEIKEKDSLL